MFRGYKNNFSQRHQHKTYTNVELHNPAIWLQISDTLVCFISRLPWADWNSLLCLKYRLLILTHVVFFCRFKKINKKILLKWTLIILYCSKSTFGESISQFTIVIEKRCVDEWICCTVKHLDWNYLYNIYLAGWEGRSYF